MKTPVLFIILALGVMGLYGNAQAANQTLFITSSHPIQLTRVAGPVERMGRRQDRRYYRRGTLLKHLPGGSVVITHSNHSYYYFDGEYFILAGNNYRVVTPPAGLRIRTLPSGHTVVVRNGHRYYLVNNVYYEPVFENGNTYYITVSL